MTPLAIFIIPSGKRLHNYRKSPFLMGKSTISMTIFNSYVCLPEGKSQNRTGALVTPKKDLSSPRPWVLHRDADPVELGNVAGRCFFKFSRKIQR